MGQIQARPPTRTGAPMRSRTAERTGTSRESASVDTGPRWAAVHTLGLHSTDPEPAQGEAEGVHCHQAQPVARGVHSPTDLSGTIVKIGLLGLAYYGTAILSLRLALVRGQVTPIWPPTGIALVALLLFG